MATIPQQSPLGSMSQRAYVEIRRRIFSEDLPEGAPIRQDELAIALGMSKTPIREALVLLQSAGLITMSMNTGARVTSLSPRDYVEILDIRLALETRALELSIPALKASDLNEARETLCAHEVSENERERSELNQLFHARLYAKCGRPRLLEAIKSNQENLGRLIRMRITRLATHPRTQSEHEQLLEACSKQSVDEAVALLRDHIEHTQREVRAFFRRQGE